MYLSPHNQLLIVSKVTGHMGVLGETLQMSGHTTTKSGQLMKPAICGFRSISTVLRRSPLVSIATQMENVKRYQRKTLLLITLKAGVLCTGKKK
mmetsp:Transcript_14850/g.23362  ORF Transcript_14850/g.23362 Transcript_14850/m.23362 type:complete len:94 (+) Transcript_14850:177-458(+)